MITIGLESPDSASSVVSTPDSVSTSSAISATTSARICPHTKAPAATTNVTIVIIILSNSLKPSYGKI